LRVRDPIAAPPFSERFLRRTDNGWMGVTYIYPRVKWGRRVDPALSALASNGWTLTGVNIVASALRSTARRDAARATIAGTLIVFVILAAAFKSPAYGALLFVPFVAGCTGMLGVMAALRLTFNFINIFVGLMLVGVATDYAVYILQRFRERPEDFDRLAPETGKAVIMAALTTIVGYGSFALSSYPGLRSLGYASTLGVALSGLAATTLLPALLMLRSNHG
jgi:predicted RND superfamily exporter protein